MNQNRFDLINELFNDALDLSPDARPAFLDRACGNDSDLLEAVNHKLIAYEDGTRMPSLPGFEGKVGQDILMEPGTVLDKRYEIARVIARGGMGIVYEARDLRHGLANRTVAIKQAWPDFRPLFDREIERLSMLNHQSIPSVYDLISRGRDRFLVMEFIDGTTLAELLENRSSPFDLAQVAEWARALLKTLEYVHMLTVSDDPDRDVRPVPTIHRDIKPQNLMLTKEGHLFLLDFGISRGGDSGREDHTHTGRGFRTPGYASPEQCVEKFGDVTPRSDLYSLAATLFNLLTGESPPPAIYRITAAADPFDECLDRNAKNIPEELANWFRRSMNLDPAKRPESAQTMLSELEEAVSSAEHTRNLLPGPRSRYSNFLTRGVVVLAVGAVAVAGLLLLGPKRDYFESRQGAQSEVAELSPADIGDESFTEVRGPDEADPQETNSEAPDTEEIDPGNGPPDDATTGAGPERQRILGSDSRVTLEGRDVAANFVFGGGITRGYVAVDGQQLPVLSGYRFPTGEHTIEARSGTKKLWRAEVAYSSNGVRSTREMLAVDGVVHVTVDPSWRQLRVIMHLR